MNFTAFEKAFLAFLTIFTLVIGGGMLYFGELIVDLRGESRYLKETVLKQQAQLRELQVVYGLTTARYAVNAWRR